MNGQIFERCFIRALENAIDSKGLRHDPLAKKAWNSPAAGASWRKMRSETMCRPIRMSDAFALAEAAGINFLEICGEAIYKMKEQLQTQATPAPVKKTQDAPAAETATAPASAEDCPPTRRAG